MPDLPSSPAGLALLLGDGGLAERLALGSGELALCVAVVFLAGIVRGFSGFALSALIMASLAVVIPPVSLIPVCYVLEGIASLLMFRGGAREADGRIVIGLAAGSLVGVPLGLQATLHLPPDASRLVALALILALAALQLVGRRVVAPPDIDLGAPPAAAPVTSSEPGPAAPAEPRPATSSAKAAPRPHTPKASISGAPHGAPDGGRARRPLASRVGLYGAGLLAGIATGLASVGGMIVALYVLASDAPPARMRASLVMFLFVGMFTSGAWLLATGLLDRLALERALVLAAPVAVGVLIGARLFRPSLQGFYRRFCLTLLIGLALAGLARQLLVG